MNHEEMIEALKEIGLDPTILTDDLDLSDASTLTITKPDGEVVESKKFIAIVDREDTVSTILNVWGTRTELLNMAACLAKGLNSLLDQITGRTDAD